MQTHLPLPVVLRPGTHRANCHATWEKLAQQARYRPQVMADIVGISMRTLQRYFRARYDKTVSDWLRELRLDHAFKMVKSCNSVKEVAFELGYKQPSHFTRDFKKKFGVPPRSLMPAHNHEILPPL